MKKIILTTGTIILMFISINIYSQNPDQIKDPGNTIITDDLCMEWLISNLLVCLDELTVTVSLVYVGNQIHCYVTSYQGTNPNIRGKIQNCIAGYNSSRHFCPGPPPVMILKTN